MRHQWLLIVILHAITADMGIVKVEEKPQPLNVHSVTYHYHKSSYDKQKWWELHIIHGVPTK